MFNALETAMPDLAPKIDAHATCRDEIVAYLQQVFSAEGGALASLDNWTKRRIIDQNMAKLALVLESDDPVEDCYRNLIREIDTEAESGIYLIGTRHEPAELRALASDPGISGKLHRDMARIAPVMFPDELSRSRQGMGIVWATVQARFDRARIDATVSAKIMQHILEDGVGDMTDALRSLLYSFHEDLVRRLTELPLMLNERSTRELVAMIAELARRAGDYGQRVATISDRAGTG